MHNRTRSASLCPLLGAVFVLVTSGCATIPTGPAIAVVPGSGKTLDQFRRDDAICRNFALQQTSGVSPNQAATESAAKSAVVGTALGAAAGAAFGGGRGAAIGAGSGLLAGSALGLDASHASADAVQARYDQAYAQCMTLQGNRAPALEQLAYAEPVQRKRRRAPYVPRPYAWGYDYYCPSPYFGFGYYGHYHGHHHHHYW